jgi:DNA-binding NarL/FixJ family response regulator
MFAIGVHGYLLKSAASTELLAGLYAVYRGTAALSTEIAAMLAQDAEGDGPLEPLTPRELQVLRLLGSGSTNKQISAALSLSPRTVEQHVYHLMVKLRAPSRTAAVSIARAQGLLDSQV